jgi:hypothetical protein
MAVKLIVLLAADDLQGQGIVEDQRAVEELVSGPPASDAESGTAGTSRDHAVRLYAGRTLG